MRRLLMLAAVAALSAACHNRPEEEVGAAPEQAEADTIGVAADTGAVTHAIDSTRTGPPLATRLAMSAAYSAKMIGPRP
jgi:hypothetical protein